VENFKPVDNVLESVTNRYANPFVRTPTHPLKMTTDIRDTIWKEVLRDLQMALASTVYKTVLAKSHLISLSGDVAEITVENSFAVGTIKKYAEERILAALSRHAGYPVISLTCTVVPPKQTKKSESVGSDSTLFEAIESPSREAITPPTNHQSNLNPRYTFESFIVGGRNRLAYAAARAVAEQPGIAYNPLYLYGGVGLGKTHLMQAIGNEIVRREPQKKVLYISCESFMNEFVASLQKGKPDEFKKRYRTIDVFLVDDIQFIAGKEGTQEEFFHTFNALYQTNRQIVITSDKVPSELKGLEERLSSRFAAGMIADIQLPDLETRLAILQAKCAERSIILTPDVLTYIADHVESNVRELEGALSTVILQIEAGQVPRTVVGAQQALGALGVRQRALRPSGAEQLITMVCNYYSVTLDEIKGPRRQRELVKPRQIAMYLLKHELGMGYPRIGRELGGRDHTTAMHSVEKIEKELRRDTQLLHELADLKEGYYASLRSAS